MSELLDKVQLGDAKVATKPMATRNLSRYNGEQLNDIE